jgi:hypothetical protein
MKKYARSQQQLSTIWAFEKVLNTISLVINMKESKLRFFKHPYCTKPYSVVRYLLAVT